MGLSGLFTTSLPFDCSAGVANWKLLWSEEQQEYCCMTTGVGCMTTAFPFTTPTAPPTPPPTPPPTVPPPRPRPTRPVPSGDPYNCAVDAEDTWGEGKKAWCCRVHHKGCPGQIGCATTSKPYDCMAGYSNWMAGWSVAKKAWCCKNEGKGCPPAAGGCA